MIMHHSAHVMIGHAVDSSMTGLPVLVHQVALPYVLAFGKRTKILRAGSGLEKLSCPPTPRVRPKQ